MCELQPDAAISFCHSAFSASDAVAMKVYQKRSFIAARLLPKMSISSLPGVVTSMLSNPSRALQEGVGADLLIDVIAISPGLDLESHRPHLEHGHDLLHRPDRGVTGFFNDT